MTKSREALAEEREADWQKRSEADLPRAAFKNPCILKPFDGCRQLECDF
jgi:hypothetical protein